jgi:DNA-binding LacI/PurR family transcriptional regulator
MPNKQPTIYDIAREAGVSIATVSRVMSGHPNVSEKTLKKVQSVIQRHHYAPSFVAKGLEGGKTGTIGIILPEVSNPYYARLYCAAEDEARRRGYSVWLYQLPQNRPYVEREVVQELIRRRLDGAFFMGGIVESQHEDLPAAISELHRFMPVVAICPPIEGLECICLYNDLASAIRQAVQHLHMLGHSRIAFVGGSSVVRNSGARGRGFLEALAELDLKDDTAYHHEGGYTAEAGEIALLKLLTGLPRENWPTAIIAFNDLVALGAMKQLSLMGLSLPRDMAVIGCDNSFFAPYTNPPLTSIDLHPEEHARSAISELLAAVENPVAPFTLMRDATLVIRESCGVKLGRRKLD